jgi:hypothetical protein
MAEELMNQFESPYAARKQGREMDTLQESPVTGRILDALSGPGATVATIGAAIVPAAAPALAVARASLLGLGLFRNAWKFGKPSVEKMVEDMDAEADREYQRIWKALNGNAARQQEFEARLQGQEAESARLSALFHGLRTSDPEKHVRLSRLTINCVFEEDLKPESLDNMMRAVVELKEADVSMLGKIYEAEKPMLDRMERARQGNQLPPNLHSEIQPVWQGFIRLLNPTEQLVYRSSLARLQSHGMIQQVSFSNFGLGHEPYLLLDAGAKFYERLLEVSALV